MPSSRRPEVYLDLDRTLFETGKFIETVWRVIGEVNHGVDSSLELSRLMDFYIDDEHEGYRDYDFSAHVRAVGLPVEQTYELIRHSLEGRNFEYPGVDKLLQRLGEQGLTVKIFTYGRDDFQKLKFSLSPSLVGYELIVVLEPKQHFFERLGKEAILLDDKPVGGLMPGSVIFVQSADYNGVQPSDKSARIVSSLEEFGDMVEELIDGDKNI